MSALPSTVDVNCPRCDVPIACTLAIKTEPPKPGAKSSSLYVNVSVPDLGDKIRDHYETEHGYPPRLDAVDGIDV